MARASFSLAQRGLRLFEFVVRLTVMRSPEATIRSRSHRPVVDGRHDMNVVVAARPLYVDHVGTSWPGRDLLKLLDGVS